MHNTEIYTVMASSAWMGNNTDEVIKSSNFKFAIDRKLDKFLYSRFRPSVKDFSLAAYCLSIVFHCLANLKIFLTCSIMTSKSKKPLIIYARKTWIKNFAVQE